MIDLPIVVEGVAVSRLPGITRDSVITLLRGRGLAVEERRISIGELIALHERGDLLECFGTGTAATITHIRRVRYREHELNLPPVGSDSVGSTARTDLIAVATGRATDTHGWVTAVPGTPAARKTTGKRSGAS